MFQMKDHMLEKKCIFEILPTQIWVSSNTAHAQAKSGHAQFAQTIFAGHY